MKQIDIVRAWKDEEYRSGLSEEERALIPEHPVGEIELTDSELDMVHGAYTYTVPCGCEFSLRYPQTC